jgi:hypothetical protein
MVKGVPKHLITINCESEPGRHFSTTGTNYLCTPSRVGREGEGEGAGAGGGSGGNLSAAAPILYTNVRGT